MQTFMRQFTIRTRMVGAIAVVLLLLAVVGGAGLWACPVRQRWRTSSPNMPSMKR